MSIAHDEIDFDEAKWEDMLNSDEILTEEFLKAIDAMDNGDVICQNNDIVKLSFNDFGQSTFLNTNQFLRIGRPLTILIPPSPQQRVRYENECKQIFRYISVPNSETLTITIPDLRNLLPVNDVLWMRITRTTINHRSDSLIFYHPYPIWIKNSNAKIHNGSIFIPITNKDMNIGFVQISTLAMIRLKQDDLKKITKLAIYSPTQLDFFGMHPVEIVTAKGIRDEYHLRQSVLNFQLVRVDQNNVAYPTDCLCQTEPLHELEAHDQQQKLAEIRITKSKNINRKKKV